MATQITLQRSHNEESYPSSERMFEEKFTSFGLLTERSPNSLMTTCREIAVLLAVHGLIAESVDLIELSDMFSKNGIALSASGVYFAFEAVNLWPSTVPEEHKTVEHLNSLDTDPLGDWGQIVIDPRVNHPPLSVDEEGLARLLKYIEGDQKKKLAYPSAHFPGRVCILFLGDVRSMAIDFALRLGHEAEAERLLVGHGTDPISVAKSRIAWKLLKDGKMFSQANIEEARVQYRRLKDVLSQRLEKGPLNPLKDRTLLELVELLDKQTIAHDEDQDGNPEEYKLQNFRGNSSIRYEPATDSQISTLEQKLNTSLPGDYKEFLKISNGLRFIWNGYFRQGFLGQLDEIQKGEHILQGNDALEFSLMEWSELPFKVEWPKLDQQQALHVSSLNEEGDVWLVEPSLVTVAKKAFWDVYNDPGTSEEARKTVLRVVSDHFGSTEEFNDMEWAVVAWTHWGMTMQVWKSFRDFLEHLVVQGEK
jgi:hypothetical protein